MNSVWGKGKLNPQMVCATKPAVGSNRLALALVSTIATISTPIRLESIEMKVMTARDAKNHFGEFLDSARREPVVITKNDRPVGIMISLEDAKDTLFADFLMEQDPGYGDWLFGKVTKTMGRVADGTTGLTEHSNAMAAIRVRLQARAAKSG